jgi:hypothetical protein
VGHSAIVVAGTVARVRGPGPATTEMKESRAMIPPSTTRSTSRIRRVECEHTYSRASVTAAQR